MLKDCEMEREECVDEVDDENKKQLPTWGHAAF